MFLRILVFITLSLFLSLPAYSGQLLSSGLCEGANYNEKDKQCKSGYLLRGDKIEVEHTTPTICLLCAYRTTDNEELTHVWYFNGTRIPQEHPTVWREDTRSFLDDVSNELEWIKSKKEIGVVTAIASVVKLIRNPSDRYRTMSCKALSQEWVGPWEVKIFDERTEAPLASYSFKVK